MEIDKGSTEIVFTEKPHFKKLTIDWSRLANMPSGERLVRDDEPTVLGCRWHCSHSNMPLAVILKLYKYSIQTGSRLN